MYPLQINKKKFTPQKLGKKNSSTSIIFRGKHFFIINSFSPLNFQSIVKAWSALTAGDNVALGHYGMGWNRSIGCIHALFDTLMHLTSSVQAQCRHHYTRTHTHELLTCCRRAYWCSNMHLLILWSFMKGHRHLVLL